MRSILGSHFQRFVGGMLNILFIVSQTDRTREVFHRSSWAYKSLVLIEERAAIALEILLSLWIYVNWLIDKIGIKSILVSIIIMVYLHILMTRNEGSVFLNCFIVMKASGCTSFALLTQWLVRFEVIAFSLVLVLILVFVWAIGDAIVIQICILFRQHIHPIHVCFISLTNHQKYIYRSKANQNEGKASTSIYFVPLIFKGLVRTLSSILQILEFLL